MCQLLHGTTQASCILSGNPRLHPILTEHQNQVFVIVPGSTQSIAAQNVVHEPAALVSPRSFLEMQILPPTSPHLNLRVIKISS